MNFSRIMRLAALYVLIGLAATGAGFLGGVPLPLTKRKEHDTELFIEQVEQEENEDDTVDYKVKK
jgi:hypothetical protein